MSLRPPRPATVALLLAVLGALLFVTAVPTLSKASHTMPLWDAWGDWLAAQGFVSGHDPYTPAAVQAAGLPHLGKAPTIALWFLPFASLELAEVGPALAMVMLVLLFAHCVFIATELEWPVPLASATALFGLVSSASFVVYLVRVGQVSELIAALLVLAWMSVRRGRDGLAGVCLGLACTIKPFPGLIVVGLALARRWRVVVGAGAAFLPIALVVTLRFGLASWSEFSNAQAAVLDHWIPDIQNESLTGIVARLLAPACESHRSVAALATAIAAPLALALFAAAARLGLRHVRESREVDLYFAALVVLSTFLNPLMWEHYTLILLLPIAIVATHLARLPRDALAPRWRVAGGLAIGAIVALTRIEFTLKAEAAREIATHPELHLQLHLLEVAGWLHVPLLLALLLLLLRWEHRRMAPRAQAVR